MITNIKQVEPKEIFSKVQKLKSITNFDSRVEEFILRMKANQYSKETIIDKTNQFYHVSKGWITSRFHNHLV